MHRDAFALKIQRKLSPEMRPKNFGTFKKRAPASVRKGGSHFEVTSKLSYIN